MVGNNTKARSPLLPDRMQQGDFFVCDIFDAAPKGETAAMEHPVFSISTKPDKNIRRYENGDIFVEVVPSVKGLATVYDRDILIFCISQVIAALNDGREVNQTVRFKAFDLLSSTNRGTDGRGYEQLRAAFERLSGTRIFTNVTTADTEVLDGFGLIDRYRIVRETRDGRMQEIEVKLSDWVFNAINAREVLTLSRNYFRLRKPLERRLYEIARKHCGYKQRWAIGLTKLKEKWGSYSTDKEFNVLFQRSSQKTSPIITSLITACVSRVLRPSFTHAVRSPHLKKMYLRGSSSQMHTTLPVKPRPDGIPGILNRNGVAGAARKRSRLSTQPSTM